MGWNEMIQVRRAGYSGDGGFAVVESAIGAALLAAAGVAWRIVSGLPDGQRGLISLLVLLALAICGGVATAVVSDRRDRRRTLGLDPPT